MPTVLQGNIRQAKSVLDALETLDEATHQSSRLLSDTLLGGGKLIACGNGGSAADAAHLTTEFVSRFNRERRPFPALCLNAHGGDLTALGNDYAFEEIFARQIEAFGRPGDLLMAFTTSGNSENVRRALLQAKSVGMQSVALLGRDGGRCAGLANVELLVRHTSTARIQEAHKLLLHTICEMVESDLAAAGH